MENEEHPIIDVTINVGDKTHRFAVENFAKGPDIHGQRGSITSIAMRKHGAGAEFGIYVSNNGIERLWQEVSSNSYIVKRNIKSEL